MLINFITINNRTTKKDIWHDSGLAKYFGGATIHGIKAGQCKRTEQKYSSEQEGQSTCVKNES